MKSIGRGTVRYAGRLAAVPAIIGMAKWTGQLGKTITAPPRPHQPRRDSDFIDFDQEMRRIGISAGDLEKKRRELLVQAWMSLLVAVVLVAWAIRMLLLASTISDFVFALISPCAALPMLALAATAAFRHWQIRKRRLGGWHEWLSTPSEWLP
ncbi:hypothetical protein CWS72_24080 [Telmatospirillum siberiense]|uniref:Uncharacterized protein n=1 Tax=Telmatospirillum siberiense TaxID=382514 RepID=A0A2N3PNL4_9PROT|nr:hypothetical protein CWS72_24080 [Telmatospirillum siberiense]